LDHRDHVALLRPAIRPGGVWADIGAGRGAFTLAIADLLGSAGRIIAIDRDAAALEENVRGVRHRFPEISISSLIADLEGPLDLPALDGLVAANSLHFVAGDRQADTVRRLASHLRPGGRFVVVEYDVDRGNPWVPHPFSFATWQQIAAEAGLVGTRPTGRVPSRFLQAIYSAVSLRPEAASGALEPQARPISVDA
jgi:SAM-dependent methyltransferase